MVSKEIFAGRFKSWYPLARAVSLMFELYIWHAALKIVERPIFGKVGNGDVHTSDNSSFISGRDLHGFQGTRDGCPGATASRVATLRGEIKPMRAYSKV